MIYHIIDHAGIGTIHNIVWPLSVYENHTVINLDGFNKFIITLENLDSCMDCIIIHSSGSSSGYVVKHINIFFYKFSRVFVFMHTSVKYQIFKNRLDFIHRFLRQPRVVVLTPSDEVTGQYKKYGCNAITVQLGIPEICQNWVKDKFELHNYYNKFLSTCASIKSEYQYIKGIDKFISLSQTLGIQQQSLICGNVNMANFACQKFCYADFVNVLSHSKAYIQLSRYESYNTTAILAKQLRIPIFILNTEGVHSCLKGVEFCDETALEKALKNYINSGALQYDINTLYEDSKKRENIGTFCQSIKDAVNYDCKK